MKEFIVSLYAITPSMNLADLSDRLGVQGHAHSRDIGTPRPSSPQLGKRFWDHTEWRLKSSLAPDAPLEQHLANLQEKMALVNLTNPNLPADLVLSLDIAVMTDGPMCSVLIPPSIICTLAEHSIGVEVTYYPCAEEG